MHVYVRLGALIAQAAEAGSDTYRSCKDVDAAPSTAKPQAHIPIHQP